MKLFPSELKCETLRLTKSTGGLPKWLILQEKVLGAVTGGGKSGGGGGAGGGAMEIISKLVGALTGQ